MSALKKTDGLEEVRRIRIHGLTEARALMEEYGITSLAEFFITYESKNQELAGP